MDMNSIPIQRAGFGNVKIWYNGCPCMANSHQHSGSGFMHYWRYAAGSQASEDLHIDVWQKTGPWRDYQELQERIVKQLFIL